MLPNSWRNVWLFNLWLYLPYLTNGLNWVKNSFCISSSIEVSKLYKILGYIAILLEIIFVLSFDRYIYVNI